MKKLLVVVTCLMLFGASPIAAGAASGTGPPPIPTCGPGAGPCQETDHFGVLAFIGAPLPGCSTLSGFALITTTGNGVQHINVNSAQDFWLTMTMVGPTTIVQGTPGVDANGNPTFTPDPNLPTFTGQLQQWFGAQFNNKNLSMSGTANFQGTSSTGASASLHFNVHANSTGAAPTLPNLNSLHFDVTCS